MSVIKKISFHGSTLAGFSCDTHNVYLSVEEVTVGRCRKNLKVTVIDYTEVNESLNLCSGASLMKEEDGEILSLKYTTTSINLVVEWNNFELKKRETEVYEISGRSVAIEILKTSD